MKVTHSFGVAVTWFFFLSVFFSNSTSLSLLASFAAAAPPVVALPPAPLATPSVSPSVVAALALRVRARGVLSSFFALLELMLTKFPSRLLGAVSTASVEGVGWAEGASLEVLCWGVDGADTTGAGGVGGGATGSEAMPADVVYEASPATSSTLRGASSMGFSFLSLAGCGSDWPSTAVKGGADVDSLSSCANGSSPSLLTVLLLELDSYDSA